MRLSPRGHAAARGTRTIFHPADPPALRGLLLAAAILSQGRRTVANEAGPEEHWELKDLRKTCATSYDEHVPESSVEILGHSVGGITYRHYAHRGAAGLQGDHDPPAADRVPGSGEGERWRMPVLPEAVRRRRLM